MAFDYLAVGFAGYIAAIGIGLLALAWLAGGFGKDGRQFVSKINNGVSSSFRQATSVVRWRK